MNKKNYIHFILMIISVCLNVSVMSQSTYTRAGELYEEAMKRYRERSLAEAEELIEESLYLNASAKSHYLSGLIYEALGKEHRALSAYEATLKYDPEFREAIFQKGLIALNQGDAEDALEDFTYLIKNNDHIETRGVYFQMDPTGYSQNRVVSLANLYAQMHYYRGQAYEKLAKYEEAMADYNAALEAEVNPDYYISRALLQSKLGNDSLANEDLQLALKLEPSNQIAWYNLALMNPETRLPDSLLSNVSFAPTLSLLGTRALESANYAEAKKYFDMYLQNHTYDALAYINRGRVYLKSRQYDEAREDFKKALEIQPSRSESLYLMGNAYFFEKEYRGALAYYNQYLAIDPTNGMVWYNGAMAYLELDNDQEACHFLVNAGKYGMKEAENIMNQYCQQD